MPQSFLFLPTHLQHGTMVPTYWCPFRSSSTPSCGSAVSRPMAPASERKDESMGKNSEVKAIVYLGT